MTEEEYQQRAASILSAYDSLLAEWYSWALDQAGVPLNQAKAVQSLVQSKFYDYSADLLLEEYKTQTTSAGPDPANSEDLS